MKFIERERHAWTLPADSTTVRQWVSAGGAWILQIDLVMFGVRCNVGRADDSLGFDRVYCCGQNRLAILLVPRVVMKALEELPDDATSADVCEILPEQFFKPMHNDPRCWDLLCCEAGVELPALESGRDDRIPVLADTMFGPEKASAAP